jgi:hypothetical protein
MEVSEEPAEDEMAQARNLRLSREAIFTYAAYPLLLLGALLVLPLPFSYLGIFHYSTVMPDVLVISGISVMFFGAFYDFGAKGYVMELIDNHFRITEIDMNHIYKQQVKLMGIYIGLGLLYVVCGVIIFAF